MGKTSTPETEPAAAASDTDPITCTESESDMLTGVIANVLRSLVDDPSFHQSVTKLTSEATPYFNQFKSSQGVDPSGGLVEGISTPTVIEPQSQPGPVPAAGVTQQQTDTRSKDTTTAKSRVNFTSSIP